MPVRFTSTKGMWLDLIDEIRVFGDDTPSNKEIIDEVAGAAAKTQNPEGSLSFIFDGDKLDEVELDIEDLGLEEHFEREDIDNG